jgi:hypothetical protein
VAIHPRYNKLITALRTAVENPFTSQISKSIQPLDKEATSHDDLFDAFRMSFIWFFIKVRVVTFNTNKDAKQAVEK